MGQVTIEHCSQDQGNGDAFKMDSHMSPLTKAWPPFARWMTGQWDSNGDDPFLSLTRPIRMLAIWANQRGCQLELMPN